MGSSSTIFGQNYSAEKEIGFQQNCMNDYNIEKATDKNKYLKISFVNKGNCAVDFMLLYLRSFWKEPAIFITWFTVSFVLPSGVPSGENFVHVTKDGMKLQIIVKWPTQMMELKARHKKWLSNTTVE